MVSREAPQPKRQAGEDVILRVNRVSAVGSWPERLWSWTVVTLGSALDLRPEVHLPSQLEHGHQLSETNTHAVDFGPGSVSSIDPLTAGFVSAILTAGYPAKPAGGGHYNAAALRAKIAEIQTLIPARVGITLNSLYINICQFNFQFPLWQEVKREGLPIGGFCVAAGIPALRRLLRSLMACARAASSTSRSSPARLTTRSLAGSHHSYEDFHQPILATCGSIRQHPNISLVGGSGFGDGESVWPYMAVNGRPRSVISLSYSPIHKIADRAAKLQELGETIFNLPKEKRATWLPANADMKKDGTVVKELGDMTYEGTVPRLMRLTPKQSILQPHNAPNDPGPFVTKFFEIHPCMRAAPCRRRQELTPLIPVLDASFEVWSEKDSLWAAQDIDAVFDQDPQRVAIRRGPVAIKHARVAIQPIKDMLGGVVQCAIKKLPETQQGGDSASVLDLAISYAIDVSTSGNKTVYKIGSSLPPTEEWLETLAGLKMHWLSAVLRSENIVQAGEHVSNPLRRLFAPRKGQTVIATSSTNGVRTSVSLYGSAHSFGVHHSTLEAVTATFKNKINAVTVVVNEELKGSSIPPEFTLVTVSPPSMRSPQQSTMRALFPDAVDGEPLKLVHLSNAIKVLEPSKPFKLQGCLCRWRVLHHGVPITKVKSSLLPRGHFADSENTFETIDGSDDDTKPLLLGIKLIFLVRTELAYKNKSTFGANFSAATRHFVESVATEDNSAVSFCQFPQHNALSGLFRPASINFGSVVLPYGELSAKLTQTDANKVIKFEIINDCGEKTLRASRRSLNPLWSKASLARARKSPGLVWRPQMSTKLPSTRCIYMTDEPLDKEVDVKILPLFAAQFPQIALVDTRTPPLMACARRVSSRMTLPLPVTLAASTQYSTLASIADVRISYPVEVVFCRGIAMQGAVERSHLNHSNDAMCTVNPRRISDTFNESALRKVVEIIGRRTKALIKIVDYNIELTRSFTLEKITEMSNCFEVEKKQEATQGSHLTLGRVVSCPYVSVCEYSQLVLWCSGHSIVRKLPKRNNLRHLNPDLLINKYIADPTAKPFRVTREYAYIIFDQTMSSRLDKVFKTWDEKNRGAHAGRQKLAYIIVVEPLAYHFTFHGIMVHATGHHARVGIGTGIEPELISWGRDILFWSYQNGLRKLPRYEAPVMLSYFYDYQAYYVRTAFGHPVTTPEGMDKSCNTMAPCGQTGTYQNPKKKQEPRLSSLKTQRAKRHQKRLRQLETSIADLVIYTDGSLRFKQEDQQTGSGIVGFRRGEPIEIEVSDAEMQALSESACYAKAILHQLGDLHGINRIWFIRIYKGTPGPDEEYLLSFQDTVHATLDRYPQIQVNIERVPAHHDILGNKVADNLAKRLCG
ncbi:hypothetical protein DL93DRAFT_2103254 [Clavulina sp. PMI_390]|nr:hypothetical protein DL93DRAFT_2103254 [Clavulina sp. PMI_390]